MMKNKYELGYKAGYGNGLKAGVILSAAGYGIYKFVKWVKTPIVEE